MNEEIESIRRMLRRKFDLKSKVEGSYILINEFDGYIVDDNTYLEIEDKAIEIVDSIRCKFDVDCDYEIMGDDGEYDLRFEII